MAVHTPSKRAISRYVSKLRKRGLSDAEIEYELHVDPESPIVRVTELVRQSIFGSIEPRTREELKIEYKIEENVEFYRWVTAGDPEVCSMCASRVGKELPDTVWDTIGKPPWSERTASRCRCKLARAEG